MVWFIASRIKNMLFTLLGIVFIIMLILVITPGDPARMMLPEIASQEQVDTYRSLLGLDQPFHIRYVQYLSQIFRGDLGRSYRAQRPVFDLLRVSYPASIELMISGMVLIIAVAIPIGVAAAVKPYSLFDAVARTGALITLSMPSFWLGLLLIYFLSFQMGLVPLYGRGTLSHLILPSLALAAPSVATISRVVRSRMMDVLRSDYIRTARAKGLSERVVTFKHGLKNAMIPIVTLLGLRAATLMGGAIVTEVVFTWPGMGRLMVQAIMQRDYMVVQSSILVYAITLMLINFLVDLSYVYLDPRVKYN